MAEEICIPRLGTVGNDATLTSWVKAEGERVEAGDVVLNIETQKINYEVVAETSGYLHIIMSEGETCPVGTVVGLIAASVEDLSAGQSAGGGSAQAQNHATTSINAPAPVADGSATSPASTPRATGARIKISPAARKMAKAHEIDPATVQGTGPGGRIVRKDIESAVARKSTASAITAAASDVAAAGAAGQFQQALADGKRVKYTVPLKGMRAAIAERMHQSLAQAAQLSALGEIDMSEVIALRKAMLAQEDKVGIRVTYNDILVFVLAKVLKEMPIVNSSITGNEISAWQDVNIGIAVALDDGLIVPVIKNADQRSISDISRTTKELVAKARTGSLGPDDISNGTFTVSNLGSAGAGWRFETTIINPPEAAILGVGGITDRAVVRDGQIVIRPIMTYNFTYDHRVFDGAVAVSFMARFIEVLENPILFNL